MKSTNLSKNTKQFRMSSQM